MPVRMTASAMVGFALIKAFEIKEPKECPIRTIDLGFPREPVNFPSRIAVVNCSRIAT